MFLKPFYLKQDEFFHVSPDQASRFAKDIAADFNPIHNANAKRFCVPGDLLFALTLNQKGLYQNMSFHFQGMVGKNVPLRFVQVDGSQICLQDQQEKAYLTVNSDGEKTTETGLIEAFIKNYVAFSGHNFIHILQPLMEENQIMVNPDRPLIIYEKMSFQLSRFDSTSMQPKLVDTELTIKGKRGDVVLHFDLLDGEQKVGFGEKTLILSGLRPFEKSGMDKLVQIYNESRSAYSIAS